MGIFTASKVINESAVENVFRGITVEESAHEPSLGGAMAVISENEENYYNMMKAIGIMELRTFEETGSAVIYENKTADGFFDNVKEFFKRVGLKIKSLIKSFITRLNSMFKSDASFVKKYERILRASKPLKGFEGYNFTVDPTILYAANTKMGKFLHTQYKMTGELSLPANESSREEMENKVKAWKEDDSKKDKLRGASVGKGSLTPKELKEYLFAKLRNGEKDKKVVNISGSDAAKVISNVTITKAALKKIEQDVEKIISNIIKNLERSKKEVKSNAKFKDSKDVKSNRSVYMQYVSESISANKSKMNVINVINGSILSAIKAERNQAKAVAIRLINQSGVSTTSTNESATSSSDLLSNVIFR